MDSTAAGAGSLWIKSVQSSSLAKTGRIHTCIEGRYVSILHLQGKLTCIDAICFHAGGPLSLGDIEEVAGKPCLVCPWHHYKVDAFTGEKYYQAVTWKDGKMVPGEWKSNGPRQRVHQVEARADGFLYVLLDGSAAQIASDEYAFKTTCGERLTGSPITGAKQSGSAVGADGKRPQ